MRGIAAPAGKGDLLDEAIRSAENLGMVLIETPVNPTLVMSDIRGAYATIEALEPSEDGSRPLVMIDNTMLGPAFQHPLPLGADLVVYSGTKYLAGHSDLLAGVILGKDPALVGKIRRSRSLFGNILQPDECWMLNGRLPTVGLRMNRQSKNAQRIAEALHGHPKISRVIYPTLFDDPEQVAIYKEQCEFPGGMFSIVLHGGKSAAFDFLRHTPSDEMPSLSAASRRWLAIPTPPRIPASPRKSLRLRACRMDWCVSQSVSRIGGICWLIFSKPLNSISSTKGMSCERVDGLCRDLRYCGTNQAHQS